MQQSVTRVNARSFKTRLARSIIIKTTQTAGVTSATCIKLRRNFITKPFLTSTLPVMPATGLAGLKSVKRLDTNDTPVKLLVGGEERNYYCR